MDKRQAEQLNGKTLCVVKIPVHKWGNSYANWEYDTGIQGYRSRKDRNVIISKKLFDLKDKHVNPVYRGGQVKVHDIVVNPRFLEKVDTAKPLAGLASVNTVKQLNKLELLEKCVKQVKLMSPKERALMAQVLEMTE